jgi:hypothetical protein
VAKAVPVVIYGDVRVVAEYTFEAVILLTVSLAAEAIV